MTKEERKQQISNLKSHWEESFKILGLTNPYFYPKPVIRKGGEEPFVNMFPTEMADQNGIFTEVVDFYLNPEATRKLLRYRYNAHFKEEYELMTTPIGEQYKVPFAELEEVKIARPKTPIVAVEEINVDQLTARDWACIHLRVPESGKDWLNEIIKKAK